MTDRAGRRIRIVWTETAKRTLKALPKKVRVGLLAKADELYECDDPRAVHKPLVGPLAGYYRIPYSRYRAIYRVDEEKTRRGQTLVTLTVCFVAAGIRREKAKDDVYTVAKKIVELGVLDLGTDKPDR